MSRRLIIFSELKPLKGIPYCRDHLRRLWKAGKFPRPVEIGPGRLAWIEEEIDARIEEAAAKRDIEAPAEGTAQPELRQSKVAKPAPGIAERSSAPQRHAAPGRSERSALRADRGKDDSASIQVQPAAIVHAAPER